MALPEKVYDFYLVFHESDSERADEILEHFENEQNGGFRGFHPERDNEAGSCITNLSIALERSRLVFILLSKKSFDSGWFKLQLESSLLLAIQKEPIRIIPIYLEPVKNIFMDMIIGVSWYADVDEFWTKMRMSLDY